MYPTNQGYVYITACEESIFWHVLFFGILFEQCGTECSDVGRHGMTDINVHFHRVLFTNRMQCFMLCCLVHFACLVTLCFTMTVYVLKYDANTRILLRFFFLIVGSKSYLYISKYMYIIEKHFVFFLWKLEFSCLGVIYP